MGWGMGSSAPYPSTEYPPSSSLYGEDGAGGRCSTRRMITSKCKTEEVDGRLIRKCEKTEKILRECVGRPVEVVESTTEHTEDDVTDRPGWGTEGGGSVDFFGFPGLRSDMESIQRNLEGGLRSFLGAAEELTADFFRHSNSPPQPPPVEKKGSSAGVDFPGQLTDV